jgi:hypothetical protein
MVLRDTLSSVIAFLRAGYPSGAPRFGYAPVLALLPRRMCDDELTAIAATLAGRPIDDADVGVEILRVTDVLPAPDDIDRVHRRLDATGWSGA